MPRYILAFPAAELVRLLRAETDAAHGQPELNTSAWKEYVIEENFERTAYGIHDGEEFDLVTAVAVLNIEPRVEHDYWVLRIAVERAMGPRADYDENGLERMEMALEAFAGELRATGRKRIIVGLDVETAAAKRQFDDWLADMQSRHPRTSAFAPAPAEAADPAQASIGSGQMAQDGRGIEKWSYGAREAIGVFHDPDSLEAAVDELEISGFDRAAISVLATDATARERIERLYRTIAQVEDGREVARSAFVSRDSRIEGEAIAVGIPFYIGGVAGAAAVVASGGALAPAFAAAIAGGAAGAGLGGLLAAAIAHRHSARIHEQVQKGGLILWVNVTSPDMEARALAVLKRMGGENIHIHEIQREWTTRDISFAGAQFDPFLERDT